MSFSEKPRRSQGQRGFRSGGGSTGSSHNYRQDGDKQGGNPRGQRRHQGDPESYNSNQRGNFPNRGGYNKRYKDKTEGNLDPTAQEFTPKDASPTLMGDNSEEGSFISSSASESCDVSLSEAAKHLPKEPIIEEQKPTAWDAFTNTENPAPPADNDTVAPSASGVIQDVRYRNQKGAVKKHQKSIDVAPMPDQLEANMNFSNKATSYEIFDQKLPSLKRTIKFVVVSEEQGNLFEKDKSYALANCVAADLNMGSGIALTFRQDFKGLGELMAQGPHTGGLVYLHFKEERYIYYLVTKRESVKKPTYETLYKSLEKLREHMVENNVKLLAIPRLGCGLDRLEWDIVKVMIEYIFIGTDIKITVCNYQQAEGDMQMKKIDLQYRKCPTKYLPESIKNIKGYNIVLYIGSLDGGIDNNLKNLFSRFSAAERTYKNAMRRMGEIVTTPIENYTFYVVGCIAKTKIEYDIDCVQFEKCISTVKKENEKYRKTNEHYESVAIQTYASKTDDLYMAKLQNLMKTYLYGVTIYIYEY